MTTAKPDLTSRSHVALENVILQGALKRATTTFIERRGEAVAGVHKWEALRDRAREIKEHTIENLDYYLEKLVQKGSELGGANYLGSTREEPWRDNVQVAPPPG